MVPREGFCHFIVVVIFLQGLLIQAWIPLPARSPPRASRQIDNWHLSLTTSAVESTNTEIAEETDFKPSFYASAELNRRGRPIWKQRKQLSELKIGDQLHGCQVVQEHLRGVTGPKLFLECGIGRYNSQKKSWKMVNAMLRLGKRGAKKSVTTKRVARLKKKKSIQCYVSRIRLESGQLEVVLNQEDVVQPADDDDNNDAKVVPLSSLRPGQEVVGTVQRLAPYGAFVDVGCNRNGLLHIQKVADLYGSYIDKEKGLKEAGLERGSKIKVQIESNEKKRIFLDFTSEVKAEAEKERSERQKLKDQQQQQKEKPQNEQAAISSSSAAVVGTGAVAAITTGSSASVASTSPTTTEADVSQQEADAWAAYAAEYQNDDADDEEYDDDEYDDYDDDYDEDRDIEDALGLGTY